MPGDAVTVAPNNYKTLLDNDRIRLLEYRGKPGDKTAMHSHPDILAYAIAGGKFRFAFPDGQSMEVELHAGESMFVEGMSHSTEQLGPDEAHVLLVELK